MHFSLERIKKIYELLENLAKLIDVSKEDIESFIKVIIRANNADIKFEFKKGLNKLKFSFSRKWSGSKEIYVVAVSEETDGEMKSIEYELPTWLSRNNKAGDEKAQ